MLPIIFNNGTKYYQYLHNMPKTYIVISRLCKITNTHDSEGKDIYYGKINFKYKYLEDVIKEFIGLIKQTPSIYSAVKINGIRAYKYARNNINININYRNVFIYKIKILFWNNFFLKLKVKCSKGTYIRSLIHDIGLKLNCGAYVLYLRRVKIGNYNKIINFNKILKLYKK